MAPWSAEGLESVKWSGVSRGAVLGPLKIRETDFLRAGMEVPQAKDFPAMVPQERFAGELRPIPISPAAGASRPRLHSMEKIRSYRCMFRELCWPAAASRPDTRLRLGRLAPTGNPLQVCDI